MTLKAETFGAKQKKRQMLNGRLGQPQKSSTGYLHCVDGGRETDECSSGYDGQRCNCSGELEGQEVLDVVENCLIFGMRDCNKSESDAKVGVKSTATT